MTETSSKRDQLIALQADMRADETAAMLRLNELLTSTAMSKVIKEMQQLKDQCLPGSVAESQLSACIDVPVNVINWLSANYAKPVTFDAPGTQTVLPPVAPAA